MNDQKMETKVAQDANDVKKDVATLFNDGVSFLNESIEKLSGDAKETAVNAAQVVKEEVGHGLSVYNIKAQELADKVPGGLGEKAAKYPWVTVSIALVTGFLLANLLRPSRKHLG